LSARSSGFRVSPSTTLFRSHGGLQAVKGAEIAHLQLHRIERPLLHGCHAGVRLVFRICKIAVERRLAAMERLIAARRRSTAILQDRKSTRLNSSHLKVLYAV